MSQISAKKLKRKELRQKSWILATPACENVVAMGTSQIFETLLR